MIALVAELRPDARDPGLVRVRVADELFGPIRRDDAERLGLEPGRRWTARIEREVLALVALAGCRADALRRLGRRDMPRATLVQRLSVKWGEKTATQIAAALASDGWIDDDAYAARRAEALQRRAPMAEEAVRGRLEAEGVDEDSASVAARASNDPKALRSAVRAWASTGRDAAWIARTLGRRGFDADTISAALLRAGLPCTPED